MNQDEFQILLDINSSGSFQELRTKAAQRLSVIQQSLADQGYYNGTYKNPLTEKFESHCPTCGKKI